jgi:Mce-associated membrane protein
MSDESNDEKTPEVTDTEGADVVDTETDTDTDTAAPDEPDATVADEQPAEPATAAAPKRSIQWSRVVAFGLLPALALVLALGAGFLKWQASSVDNAEAAAEAAKRAATESTIALLSYTPDKVEEQLGAARDLLTGEFQQSYTDLTNDVVIPGAKEQQIAAVASVPAAAAVSAEPDRAVVLLFVNQTVNIGGQPPTDTASSVRVTLEKVDGRWLISQFDPI